MSAITDALYTSFGRDSLLAEIAFLDAYCCGDLAREWLRSIGYEGNYKRATDLHHAIASVSPHADRAHEWIATMHALRWIARGKIDMRPDYYRLGLCGQWAQDFVRKPAEAPVLAFAYTLIESPELRAFMSRSRDT